MNNIFIQQSHASHRIATMDAGNPKRNLIPAEGHYRPPQTGTIAESKSVETEIHETRPNMSELRSIERERRDLLLRVSFVRTTMHEGV